MRYTRYLQYASKYNQVFSSTLQKIPIQKVKIFVVSLYVKRKGKEYYYSKYFHLILIDIKNDVTQKVNL